MDHTCVVDLLGCVVAILSGGIDASRLEQSDAVVEPQRFRAETGGAAEVAAGRRDIPRRDTEHRSDPDLRAVRRVRRRRRRRTHLRRACRDRLVARGSRRRVHVHGHTDAYRARRRRRHRHPAHRRRLPRRQRGSGQPVHGRRLAATSARYASNRCSSGSGFERPSEPLRDGRTHLLVVFGFQAGPSRR
ncbi:Uncharacterised protein [Clostridioides difficile]|nr:Uncharacterised protein [Clostridioides difficile]